MAREYADAIGVCQTQVAREIRFQHDCKGMVLIDFREGLRNDALRMAKETRGAGSRSKKEPRRELDDSEAGRRKILKRLAILKDSSNSILDELARRSRVETRPRGRILFRAGDGTDAVLVLADGRVRLSRSSRDDREYLVSWREPVDLVTETGVCGSATQRETAEVVSDATLLSLPLRAVRKAIEAEAGIAVRLVQVVARRRWDLEDHVERLLFRTVESRLAERILGLAAQYGQADPRGTLVTVKVTHAEMSRSIGATRETVTLTLGAMRRRGLIDFDRRRIVVRDTNRLHKLV